MMRTRRSFGNLAALLVAGLVASGCGRGADGELPSNANEATRAAFEACRDLGWTERRTCYQERLYAEIETAGTRAALQMLDDLAVADFGVRSDGHQFTHGIGIAAYTPDRAFAEMFRECTVTMQSGCYHGIVQGHFLAADAAPSPEDVAELCTPYEADGDLEDSWLLFQCLHGLGHGLTMYYGHHLPAALEACDHLESGWSRESCYGGAFMENVMGATSTHHVAAAASHGGAAESDEGDGADGGHAAAQPGATHGGHDHHGATTPSREAVLAELEPWEALREDDLHYPCSAFGERYQRGCYVMQTSIMLRFLDGDVGKTAEACLGAAEAMKTVCFQSLGRDVSGRTTQDADDSARECRKVAEEWREWCYVGVVKDIIFLDATTGPGHAFCERVEDFAKTACYNAVGEQVSSLHPDDEGRRRECAGAESDEFEQTCLRGARVSTEDD